MEVRYRLPGRYATVCRVATLPPRRPAPASHALPRGRPAIATDTTRRAGPSRAGGADLCRVEPLQALAPGEATITGGDSCTVHQSDGCALPVGYEVASELSVGTGEEAGARHAGVAAPPGPRTGTT